MLIKNIYVVYFSEMSRSKPNTFDNKFIIPPQEYCKIYELKSFALYTIRIELTALKILFFFIFFFCFIFFLDTLRSFYCRTLFTAGRFSFSIKPVKFVKLDKFPSGFLKGAKDPEKYT